MTKNSVISNKKEKPETQKNAEAQDKDTHLPFSLHLMEYWAKFMIFC